MTAKVRNRPEPASTPRKKAGAFVRGLQTMKPTATATATARTASRPSVVSTGNIQLRRRRRAKAPKERLDVLEELLRAVAVDDVARPREALHRQVLRADAPLQLPIH